MLRILCDETKHKNGVASYFLNLFRRDVVLRKLSHGPISYDKIADTDILVIAHPQVSASKPGPPKSDTLSRAEARVISEFVESGKALLVLQSAFCDENWNKNINQLTKGFGILFESNAVMDPEHCVNGLPEMPLIQTFARHQILHGINIFSFPLGRSLNIDSPSFGLAFSCESSYTIGKREEKKSFPVMAACEVGKGKVVVIGSSLCFSSLFIDDFDNHRLLTNIVKWLF